MHFAIVRSKTHKLGLIRTKSISQVSESKFLHSTTPIESTLSTKTNAKSALDSKTRHFLAFGALDTKVCVNLKVNGPSNPAKMSKKVT